MNPSKGYGQRLPCYRVDYCVVPGKLMFEVFQIRWFGGGSEEQILIVASNIHSGIESWAGHEGIGTTCSLKYARGDYSILWQDGRRQRSAVHTDPGQRMLCGNLDGLLHDEILTAVHYLYGAYESFP